jgi:uncharacterized protein YjbJ (UPF0337 family)
MGPIPEGSWQTLRRRVKQRWGAVTDGELEQINGRIDELAVLIEARYGEARERVAAEIQGLIDEPASGGDNRGRRRRDRARGGQRTTDAAGPPTAG